MMRMGCASSNQAYANCSGWFVLEGDTGCFDGEWQSTLDEHPLVGHGKWPNQAARMPINQSKTLAAEV